MKKPAAPASVDEFQERLVQIADTLPKRLRQCADFVAHNTDKIALSTVAELAAGAGVQPSAFMRFCQLLGFAGFSDMQRLFRDSYGQRWPDYATRLDNLRSEGGQSPAALLAEFIEAGRLSLERLASTVDSEALDAAVAALAAAPTIHVMGMRRAFPVATYLSYAFEKMDIPSILHDGVGKLGRRHAIRPGDVVIAISFAPYTQETIDLAVYARERGNEVVAITDTVTSPLRRLGVHALNVSEVDVGSFRALSATLSLAIALAVAVGATRQSR
ncbi:DNA-binding MurR/RpiR family transcriptional regulator [Chelatococcus caeni]|uniref:DNA-binding MurR/RpiR family transcriptional regulator n=1 Tax=Chelatococcus caeni TaxID=1348468 RepID=A0A840BPL1_9HYPH|nr:MurR/RpiR family transcriptional regulator [Chelatococcus caeni]MBB4015411.1 DNA-binding MurR/RpiR family transcriptional regulator [Chelatococcus caeni]